MESRQEEISQETSVVLIVLPKLQTCEISWKVFIQICCTSWIFRSATTSSTAAYWNLASFPAVLGMHNSEISGPDMLNGVASSAPWQTVAVNVCFLDLFFWVIAP